MARAFGAVCTPDIFVYDRARKLAYRGRIDDSWKDESKVTRHELADALEALVGGQDALRPATSLDGLLDQMATAGSVSKDGRRCARQRAPGSQGALARLPRAQGAQDHAAARGDRRRVPADVGPRRRWRISSSSARRKHPSVGLATVYRTVKLLEEAGIAEARHFGPGQTLYEVAEGRAHHDHLICDACGFIIEFESDEIEQLQDNAAKRARLQRPPPPPRAVRPVREGPRHRRRRLPRRGRRPPRALVASVDQFHDGRRASGYASRVQRRSTRTVLAVALAVGLLAPRRRRRRRARRGSRRSSDPRAVPRRRHPAVHGARAACAPTAPAAPAPLDPDDPLPPSTLTPPAAAPSGAPAPAPRPRRRRRHRPRPARSPGHWPRRPPAPEPPLSARARAPRRSAPSPPQLDAFTRRTKVGAYGVGQLFVDGGSNVTAKLPLAVLSVEHRPTDWVRIAAAVQVEDGTRPGMQQALVEVSPSAAFGLRAGLLIVPIGLGNLSPEPTSYLTVDRPLTDQMIVPSVWRELGVGIFGEVVPGLRYQGAVVSGLDGTGLSAEAPLWGTRGDGQSIAVHDAARGRSGGAGRPAARPGHRRRRLHGRRQPRRRRALRVAGGARRGRSPLPQRTASTCAPSTRASGSSTRTWRTTTSGCWAERGPVARPRLLRRGRLRSPPAGGARDRRRSWCCSAATRTSIRAAQMSPYNYNPPTITGPGQLAPEAPSPSQSFRARRDRLPAAAVARAQARSAGGARRRGAAADGAAGVASAQATPRPIGTDVAAAARGATRVGLALAFNF